MGYLFLGLHIICTTGFGHTLKWSGWMRSNFLVVAALNYGFAGLFSYLLATQGRPFSISPEVGAIGLVGGVFYVISLFAYYQTIRLVGVSVSTTVVRLGVMPAVLASLLYWHEQLTATQSLGIVLALLALPLLTSHPGDKTFPHSGPKWAWLAGTFLAATGGPMAQKAFSEIGRPEDKPILLTAWFAASFALSLVALVVQRPRFQRRDVLPGLLLGLFNLAHNYFLLSALEYLPGALVFPVASAGGVLLATVTSAGLWRERLGRVALGGVAVSILALVLVNSGV